MTDQENSVLDNREDMDDLELLTRMLNGQLSPERADAVKRRLKEDKDFLEFAAPLLLTWSVPPRIQRQPRPEGEWEQAWAEFQKRTGFPQRPHEPPAAAPAPAPAPARDRVLWSNRRTWERILWLMVAFVIVVPVGATIWFDRIKPTYFPDSTDGWVAPSGVVAPEPVTDLVPYQSGWIALENGIAVELTPGAELRVARRRLRGMRHLILTGTARFRVPELDAPDMGLRTQVLVVQTPVGYVTASESEFTVVARADTTDVEVHALPGHGAIPPSPMTLAPVIEIEDADQVLILLEPGSARLVRGRNPVRLPSSR